MSETNLTEPAFQSALTGRQISYFRAMMKLIGCDQKQIAAVAGVDISTLWRWETDQDGYRATEEACLGIQACAAEKNFTILEHGEIPVAASKV